jgi:hypothetical protein
MARGKGGKNVLHKRDRIPHFLSGFSYVVENGERERAA